MVLYFSGTGNSRYVAQRIADTLGDELVSMNNRIKARDTSPVQTDGRLVIVTPTYAWRIPRLVESWLRRTELSRARQAWFVMTCGGEIGNASKYNHTLCQEKQLAYMGTAQIVMPENYIAMFNAPQAEEARQIIAKAEPDIGCAASAIAAGQAFPPPRNNLYDRFMSGPVNPIFYSFFVKAKAFAAGDTCTGCGQCAKLCPTNNITIQNSQPVWGGDCTHCMACICHCPTEAIEYGKKSVGKPRYHFEEDT
jgi:ferredoxin